MKSNYNLTGFLPIMITQLFIITIPVMPSSAQTGDTTKIITLPPVNVAGEVTQTLVEQKKFDSIPAGKKRLKYKITDEAKPFLFPTGESRIALFRLPEYVQPYNLTIASLCDCWGLKKKIYVPIAVFLDSGFRSTQVLLETDFKELNAGNSKPYRLETDVLIGEDQKHHRYLLIYTQGEVTGHVQKTASVDVNPSGGLGILPVYLNVKIRRAPVGEISLDVSQVK